MRPPRSSAGFTLIELMIAVAIVGVLAALAIPSFAHLQSRSRASEGRVNLAAIRTAEKSYFTEFGTYAATSASPPAWAPGSTSRKLAWADAGGFDVLGWQPEGAVAFQYQVVAGIETYTAEARSDMDGDGVVNVWGVVQPDENGAGLAGAFGCPATGVYDPSTGGNTMFETVGPCAAGMGQSIF